MKAIRKACVALFALCLVFALGISASASEYAPATFKTTPFEATQSGTVSTTLYVAEDSNVIDFEFQLAYDTEFVELVSAEQVDDLVGDMEITVKNGAVHISYTRTSSNLTKETALVDLTFTVKEDVGGDSYEFLRLDESYQHEAHTMIDYELYAIPMETEFAPLEIFNIGDVNLSHNISIADATVLRQHLAEIRTLSDYQLSLSDAYFDTEISIADAVRIQQYLANNDMLLGNRVSVTFLDKDGQVYRVKSVPFGGSLSVIPELPEYSGYYGGVWSLDPDEVVGSNFQNLEDSLTVYAVYKKDPSQAVTFYKERLTEVYYAQSVLTGNLNLVNKMTWQDGYTADIYWSSSDSATLNASTGVFNKPAYDTTVTLTATIISYQDGMIEAQDYIAFEYTVGGTYLCPPKDEIAAYLDTLFAETIEYDMILPTKLTNEHVEASTDFVVRLDWFIDTEEGEKPILKLERGNDPATLNLIAVATFNGTPLEGDNGRIYFDEVKLGAVSMDEVRSHIITQIAANTGLTVSEGEEMWADDTKYNSTVKWESANIAVATIENNVVSIKDVVNGTALPIVVHVTYLCGEETYNFDLSYTVSVFTDNTLLVPGTNIDPVLYDALKSATGVYGNLTTDALKSNKFVYLDLSAYPEIEDLTALTYCTNLRVLNISGLKVDETSLNQIATLTKLEALIANNCGITSLTTGGEPVLDRMINLKMLDLSYNKLTSLNSVLSKSNRYGQLEELYLNSNQLYDISALCEIREVENKVYDAEGNVVATYTENVVTNRAPMLRFLTLDNNLLDNADLEAFSNFKVLKYLSLGNNDITSVSSLKDNRSLLELHLQGNQIEDLRDLRYLKSLQSLYLSDNNIRNVFAGAREVNVSYLKYLTKLEILFLDGNYIEDISDLETLDKIAVLNITDNNIQDLSLLADKGETLVELYAENNDVDSFSFLRNLTKLKRLMLANNGTVYESALNGYLSKLTDLRALTLSGKDLRSLEFLNYMPNLVRLSVADCNLPAYSITSGSVSGDTFHVTTCVDNIAAILSLKSSLQYLDVSNNGLAYGAQAMQAYMAGNGSAVEFDSIAYDSTVPCEFDVLYEMTNLKVLYADNLADPVDAPALFSIMTGLRYLSMENCGIRDASWLGDFRNLVFVDLAGNELEKFDLGRYISVRSRGTLEYLYIDSTQACEFDDAYADFDGNILKEFSASNVKVNVMDALPDMTELTYLNLAGSGIENLSGSNEDFEGWFNLSRYKNVETLDLTGLEAYLGEALKMDSLRTLYAVGGVKDAVFQKENLHVLHDLYHNGVDSYLYSYDAKYMPKAEVEGGLILGTLEDYGCALTVAANGRISDNNPTLASAVNGYDIVWTLSNNDNYAITDNKIVVKDYTDIDDEELILTASIQVYPDQAPVSRQFKFDVTVLRVDADHINVNAVNVVDYLCRDAHFTYDVTTIAAQTKGFAEPVDAVWNEIRYTWKANAADGTELPYSNFITEGENHEYTVNTDAALGTTLYLCVEVGHYIGEEFVVDMSFNKEMHIVADTYTLTFVPDGGTVTSLSDGSVITSMAVPEETTLFTTVKVERPGFIFEGWYTDVLCTQMFWVTGMENPIMPSEDLTLYAKWTAYSFEVYFDANGGETETESMPVLCGLPYGELPVPVRPGYTFEGWYTEAEGGERITAEQEVVLEADQTLYAHWTVNNYTVNLDAMGGEADVDSVVVTYGETYGQLPTPIRTGFIFNGWYTEAESGSGITADSVVAITEDTTLYARWTACSYTVNWNTGIGYSIAVKRTASPYGGAATGTLASGATVYYGDVLSVDYAAATGYTLSGSGTRSISVTGNVTGSDIYATATANNYTYTIVYKSSNGTNLGSKTFTYAYGTTNKITPPSYTGYTTPAAQSVTWDTAGAKTIVVTYTPAYVGPTYKSGTVNSTCKITYGATVEWQNRTANSIQIRVTWTDTIAKGYYNAQAQKVYLGCNGTVVGPLTISAYYKWGSGYNYSVARSSTVSSGWMTISVPATTNAVNVTYRHVQTNIPGTVLNTDLNSSWNITIPTY